MFVDEVKVYSQAGHGGRGCVAFLRETFRPKGGPSGGNGGRGGDVIIEADRDYNNLVEQYYKPRLIAESGHAGLGKGMDGPAGKDLLIKVPCGTLIWKRRVAPTHVSGLESTASPVLSTDAGQRVRIRHAGGAMAVEYDPGRDRAPGGSEADTSDDWELVCDLTTEGQRFVLCHGGRGGLGNRNFATARRQAPRFAQPGEPGDEGEFRFELRTMADVGLVGFPNAGKSTLLTAISKARPKIAPYPFTTLTPQIGIIEYPDWTRITVCDVPGLIEGAHRDVGLGHAFLRHLARCKFLVVVVDMAGTDGRQPWEDYRTVLREIEMHDRTLLDRPRLVAANKMDEPSAAANLRSFRRRVRGVEVSKMAAGFGDGIEEFKDVLKRMLGELSKDSDRVPPEN